MNLNKREKDRVINKPKLKSIIKIDNKNNRNKHLNQVLNKKNRIKKVTLSNKK